MDQWFRDRVEAELPEAEQALVESKGRLDSVAVRLLEYKRKGLRSWRGAPLAIMDQTYRLPARRVETLRQRGSCSSPLSS